MKKAELLFDAITNIRPDLVEEALDYRFRKAKGQLQRFVALAACLALLIGVGVTSLRFMGMGGSKSNAISGNGMDAGMNQSITTDSAESEPVIKTEEADTEAPDAAPDKETAAKQFTATVLEIGEMWIMVEPLVGQWIRSSADRIVVSLPQGRSYEQFSVGSRVEVTFEGVVQESYPARVTAFDIVTVKP